MIPISKIDDKLRIYQNKKVILFGASKAGEGLYKKLQLFNVSVYAFCDNNESKWENIYCGLPIISLEELKTIAVTEDYIVQISSTYETEIAQQLENIKIKQYIMYEEAKSRISSLIFLYESYYDNRLLYIDNQYKKLFFKGRQNEIWEHLFLNKEEVLFLCLSPKTGDYTLEATLKNIPYYNVWHMPKVFLKEMLTCIDKKIKFITAVREPISAKISLVFQLCQSYNMFDFSEYWKNGYGSVQDLFNIVIQFNYKNKTIEPIEKYNQYFQHCYYRGGNEIQIFFDTFNEYIVNLYDYSFDTEKGYSIIKEGNVEVFVYQLEKLNDIQKELFVWIDNEQLADKELVVDNVGENKWYAESYKRAKKEIKISQEYFDRCLNSQYIKHFYSEEDIQKFKQRWESHIDKKQEVVNNESETEDDTLTRMINSFEITEEHRIEIEHKVQENIQALINQFTDIIVLMFQNQILAVENFANIFKKKENNNSIDEKIFNNAKILISEDGYWGVYQTSARIMEMISDLSEGDKEMMCKAIDAFEEAFKEFSDAQDNELLEISLSTYQFVQKKLQEN